MDNEKKLKKNIEPKNNLGNFLKKYPGIWFLSLLLIPMGVMIFAYDQLSYIGYVPQKVQEEAPFIPVKSTIATFSDTNNPIPLWLVMAIAICCAAGSFVIFYLLQSSREAQKASQRIRNSQKSHSQNRHKSTNFPSPPSDRENLIVILPPEKIYPLNTNTEFVGNLLNIHSQFF